MSIETPTPDETHTTGGTTAGGGDATNDTAVLAPAERLPAAPTATALADRLAIVDLLPRLGRLLDEGRHDDLRSVYADDVVVRSPRGGTRRGLDEVTTYLRDSAVEGERTQHVYTDVLVDLDGDRAEVSANTFTSFYRDGTPPHQTSSLRMRCTAVRTPEGWRLRHAEMARVWGRQG